MKSMTELAGAELCLPQRPYNQVEADRRRRNEHAERRTAAPCDPKPHIDVMSAIKTAIPTFVFSVIISDATTQQEINKKY